MYELMAKERICMWENNEQIDLKNDTKLNRTYVGNGKWENEGEKTSILPVDK